MAIIRVTKLLPSRCRRERWLYRVCESIFSPGPVVSAAFLLLLRVYFFWQLFLTGKGKLAGEFSLDKVLKRRWKTRHQTAIDYFFDIYDAEEKRIGS
jgi:hypothetical protein